MPPEFNSDSDRESISLLPVLNNVNGKARRISSVGGYRCSIAGCNETFQRLDHLDRHEFKHTGVKRHACCYDGCDKKYSILTHLRRHVLNTHERIHKEPNKTVPCELDTCDKRFTSLTNMHRHMREVHENPKLYKCSHCNESFKQKLKMRRHEISQHTGIYPFVCDKCNKGFHQQSHLQKHTATCKIYICSLCDMQFDKWSLYRKHCKEQQHVHKYKCEHCERSYQKPSELKNHMAVKHLTNKDGGIGEYQCQYENCNRSYSYERNLRHHICTAHGGRRFDCSETGCTKSFTSAQNLKKHLKRQHSTAKKEEEATDIANKTGYKTKEKIAGNRQRRKDAGVQRVSRLVKLSQLIVDKELNYKLSCRDASSLSDVNELLTRAVENECKEICDKRDCDCDLSETNQQQEFESIINVVFD